MSDSIRQQNTFHFKLGQLDCLIFLDTLHPMKLEDFFPSNLMTYLQQLSDRYGLPPALSFQTLCLLIKSDKHTILIDTGTGDSFPPETGDLVKNMRAAGIKPTDIDRIIITHAHPDHIGGNCDLDSKFIFPNARFSICRNEWDFWRSGGDLSKVEEKFRQHMLDTVHRKLFPLRDRIDLADPDAEILPGIRLIKAFGHSAGQVIVKISSNNENLLCTADLFHHPLLLVKPDLPIPLDTNSEQSCQTRIQILTTLVSPDLLVFANHFPFPGLGYIKPKYSGWVWEKKTF